MKPDDVTRIALEEFAALTPRHSVESLSRRFFCRIEPAGESFTVRVGFAGKRRTQADAPAEASAWTKEQWREFLRPLAQQLLESIE